MKKMKILFLLCSFIMLVSAVSYGQTATINSNFRINITEESDNLVYTIDISDANFANEQQARQVFNYYERHPALLFDLDYPNNQVRMKIRNIEVSTGTFDLNFINSLLERRAIAYNRKF